MNLTAVSIALGNIEEALDTIRAEVGSYSAELASSTKTYDIPDNGLPDMSPQEAWSNLVGSLNKYAEEHGYTPEDVAAIAIMHDALLPDAKKVRNG